MITNHQVSPACSQSVARLPRPPPSLCLPFALPAPRTPDSEVYMSMRRVATSAAPRRMERATPHTRVCRVATDPRRAAHKHALHAAHTHPSDPAAPPRSFAHGRALNCPPLATRSRTARAPAAHPPRRSLRPAQAHVLPHASICRTGGGASICRARLAPRALERAHRRSRACGLEGSMRLKGDPEGCPLPTVELLPVPSSLTPSPVLSDGSSRR